MRFNELSRQLEDITQRLLTKQLRELEQHGLVTRKVYAVVPPRVESSLTSEALELTPVLLALREWGGSWLKRRIIKTRCKASVGRTAVRLVGFASMNVKCFGSWSPVHTCALSERYASLPRVRRGAP